MTGAGLVLMALTYAMGVQAVQAWLGPRPLRRLVWSLPLLLAILLVVGPATPAVWYGWANALLVLSQGLMVLALLWPAPEAPRSSRRWRGMLALPIATVAFLTAWRGSYGFDLNAAFPTLTGNHPLAMAVLLVGNLATIMTALALLAAWRGEAEIALRDAAQTDALTGLANRRSLEQRGQELMANARRHGDDFLVMMIDLDHFKQVNDRHGHAQGDAVLVLLADILRGLLRPGDCAARMGGEEFVVLLARTRRDGAEAFDRRLREALQVRAPAALGFFVNFSAGWAVLRSGDRDVHDLLQRADAALYVAKGEGRGCLRGEPGIAA
jgi:diguanylate cyclase (GGDEF)-like protein